MKLLTFHLLLLAVLLQSALSASRINIITPAQLAHKFDDDDGIPFTLAKFGKIPYGAHFIGGLALADPVDACESIDHFNAGEFKIDSNIIAVVKKGNCHPSIKARNAQLAGARLVILVDDNNKDLPTPSGSAANTENIFIPTVIISKAHGDKLISFIEKLPFPPLNPDDILPIVGLNFPYDTTSDTVKLDFWLSSRDVDGISYKFLDNLGNFMTPNTQSFEFTPHFVTWDCYLCRLMGYQIPSEGGDCVSGGRYCAPDPDGEGSLTGRDVLFEDLRQACLWKTVSNPVFFDYVNEFKTKCADSTDLKGCSSQVMRSASINENAIESCVKSSFFKPEGQSGEPNDALDDNKIFAAERELQLDYEVTEFPVLLINHKPYDDDLKNNTGAFAEICKNLKTPIPTCAQYNVGLKTEPKKMIGQFAVILVIIAVLSLFAVFLFWMYTKLTQNKLKRELSLEASSMVSNYMALKDLNAIARKGSDDEAVATQ